MKNKYIILGLLVAIAVPASLRAAIPFPQYRP